MEDYTIKLLAKTIKTNNRLLIYHKTVLGRLGRSEQEAIKAAYSAIETLEQNIRDLKRSIKILRSVKKIQFK